eukprot:COSAG01_NODE_2928_length_6838_cov_168.682149_2_plen_52_part_00
MNSKTVTTLVQPVLVEPLFSVSSCMAYIQLYDSMISSLQASRAAADSKTGS